MTAEDLRKTYPTEPIVNKGELPDPFALSDGRRLTAKEEWPQRSRAWRDTILDMGYGGLPPRPASLTTETLCHSSARRLPGAPKLWSYRINCHHEGRSLSFCVRIIFPDSSEPSPAIINGDGCWWFISDDIIRRVIESGCALVMFNRTEIAEDLGYPGAPDKERRSGGIYDLYPCLKFGALSAWAWGYHRCVDLLQDLPFIDADRIAVSGHSRGGKAALLAGATDSRINLVNNNASGAGGSAAWRYVGNGGETLSIIINTFPSWFGHGLRPYLEREEDIPFDQHCLLAAIAPRPLLMTYALDDRWSNPEGMVQSVWAAGEVYRFLGAPDNIAFHLRPGEHSHTLEDWEVLLDFIAWKWMGKTPQVPYNEHPYDHLQRAFSWKAPGI